MTVKRAPRVTDASTRQMDIKVIITLCLQLDDLQIRTCFLWCPTLGDECLLETPFIDCCVKAIYPVLRKVFLYHTRPVAIIGSDSGPNYNPQGPPLAQSTVPNMVRLSKAIMILPMTQITALYHYKSAGLVTLQNHLKMNHRHFSLMVNGIVDCRPMVTFWISFSCFRDRSIRLPKETVIGIALLAPMAVMEVLWNDLTPTSDEKVETWKGE